MHIYEHEHTLINIAVQSEDVWHMRKDFFFQEMSLMNMELKAVLYEHFTLIVVFIVTMYGNSCAANGPQGVIRSFRKT